MDIEKAVEALRLTNGSRQGYARTTTFMNVEPETRPSPTDLGELIAFFAGYQQFEVVEAAGKAWLVHGESLVLRPTPEEARVTQVGVEPNYRWQFDPANLVDQIDRICSEHRIRLVAVRGPDAQWFAWFADLPSVPHGELWSQERSAAATLEEALRAAARVFACAGRETSMTMRDMLDSQE